MNECIYMLGGDGGRDGEKMGFTDDIHMYQRNLSINLIIHQKNSRSRFNNKLTQ